MNPLTDLYRWLRRIVEVPVAAVLHSHLHLIARRLAHSMLDTVARKATADGAGNRCQDSTASSTDLISQQPTGDCPAYGPEARCRFRLLGRVDGDDFASVRVNGDRSWSGLCRRLICVVVRIPGRLLNRHIMVMMDARPGGRLLPSHTLLHVLLR